MIISARYHDSRGVTLHEMGRYEEALKEESEAVRLEPGSAKYHRNRGVTLRKLNRLEESLEEIDHAIEIAPGTAICHVSRALTLRAMGREEEAQKEEEIKRNLSASQKHKAKLTGICEVAVLLSLIHAIARTVGR